MHELVKLAHETITHYLEENEMYSVPGWISDEWLINKLIDENLIFTQIMFQTERHMIL